MLSLFKFDTLLGTIRTKKHSSRNSVAFLCTAPVPTFVHLIPFAEFTCRTLFSWAAVPVIPFLIPIHRPSLHTSVRLLYNILGIRHRLDTFTRKKESYFAVSLLPRSWRPCI